MTRSVPLWIGKSDDSAIPPRVRLRIFERDGGVCWISGRKIQAGDAWDLDHKIALCNGGTHSEDNLAPALRDKHREKTKLDVKIKAKVARIRKKNLGIKRKPSRAWGYGKDDKFKMKIGGGIVPR